MPIALAKMFALLAPDRRSAETAGAALRKPLAELSYAGIVLLLPALFLISLLTIEFARRSYLIATVWPSNAIVLVVLLHHVRRPIAYAAILAGGPAALALACLVIGNSVTLCVILFIANFIEISVALALLALFQVGASNLTSFRNLLLFVFIAGGVAPIASTAISAVGLGSAYGDPWLAVARGWYSGHALGMIIVAPFLISVTSSQWHAARLRERLSEATALIALFVAICICVIYFRPVIFLVAPAILLATVRFGLVGATASTLLVAFVASTFAVMGIGPTIVPHLELSLRIFSLQMFLAITAFWALPTAALLTERDRLLGDLSRANARLAADSERKSHLVTGLRRHLSMAEENERLRLSHELHDQAGQSLIAAILELNEIDALTSGPAHQRLHLMRKKMEELGKTLHRIAWELRPPSIHELGLRKALASYIAEWGEQCGTDVDFHCDDANFDAVPDEIATAIYRIVQEGLTNIVKHAERPSDVSVVIRRQDATLQVIVEDNGCGFDVGAQGAKTGSHRGLGLDGMRERLLLLGGTLDVESASGAGTTIFARIALDGPRPAA
jgi:signal transduction histidine kinase